MQRPNPPYPITYFTVSSTNPSATFKWWFVGSRISPAQTFSGYYFNGVWYSNAPPTRTGVPSGYIKVDGPSVSQTFGALAPPPGVTIVYLEVDRSSAVSIYPFPLDIIDNRSQPVVTANLKEPSAPASWSSPSPATRTGSPRRSQP